MWDVVRRIRLTHNELYRRFLSEWTIFDFIVDHLAQTDEPTLARLVAELEKFAQDETTWLVEIPLLNLVPPRESVPLPEGAMLVRTDQVRHDEPRWGPYLKDPAAIRRHLGDELVPRNRWLRPIPTRDEPLDTRITAALLLVEEGTEELAVNLAATRARLAVAMWCLLSGPRSPRDPLQPWPTVGGWTPAAHTEFGLRRKLHARSRTRSVGERGTRITLHDLPYRVTRTSATWLRRSSPSGKRGGGTSARSRFSARRARSTWPSGSLTTSNAPSSFSTSGAPKKRSRIVVCAARALPKRGGSDSS